MLPHRLLGLLWIVVAGTLGGCRTQASSESGGGQSAAVPVTVARVLVVPIVEWDEYTGRLDAIDSVEVRSRVSGYLQSTHFDEGQLVKQGDLLAIVDPRPFEAELAATQARVQESIARLAEAEALQRQATAERAEVDAQVLLAQQRVTRARKLLKQNAMAQEEFDERNSELLQATAATEAADAKIESAKAGIATATAAIETAKANVQSAELNLDYTQIRAPVGGRISRRYVTEGNLIEGGNARSTLLTTIVSINPIHCYFDADEQAFLKYAQLSREGKRESSRDVKNPVYLRLVNETGFPHVGHMDFVDNQIDPNTGTIRGRAIFPNDDRTLTPGLFAEVRLPGSGRYDAVLIPDAAIGSDQSERFVYVVDKDGDSVTRRAIELGPIAKGLRVVRSGLVGDERIVTRGLQRIYPGIGIAPSEETIAMSGDSVLPDDYEAVPQDQWLSRRPADPPAGVADNNNANQETEQ
ncbi:MAG: efflux RND transporter periplasmic adaptor subunit [Planctomycetota bacterium]